VQDVEQLWVRRSGAGDREAFARLYERFSRTIHGVLLAWVGPQEAEDLVQEVFLIALDRIDSLERPAEVASWLCSIARNRARDHWRARRAAPLEVDEDLADARPADAGLEEEEEARAVLAAIHALPEAYRETLVLRLVEGFSGEEIALRTGLTHGSVRVNLHRGMRLLREKLTGRAG
jgi:RNA polymerase sigma-70 factor (ECF subfamily)